MNMPDTRQSYLVISIQQGRFMANLVQITPIVLEDMKVLTLHICTNTYLLP